jgi:stage IV sporulation protein FB
MPIRVHALFFVAAILALFLSTNGPGPETAGYGLLAIAVLFGSVLAHELGHCLATARAGGNLEQIVIGPLGGLSRMQPPRDPQGELVAALGGPLVNFGIVLLTIPILVAAGIDLLPIVSPWEPIDLLQGPWWVVGGKLVFWVNWLLLIVNLLPAFPLDGARILRAVVWPALGVRVATLMATRATKLTALGMCLLAWIMRDDPSPAPLPTWVALLLFATWIYFNAQQEGARFDEGEWEDDLYSYDFSQGYTSLERSSEPNRRGSGSMRRWLESRREMRRRRRQSLEQDEERQVDEILMRLHESGIHNLSSKEKALLNRVSARYRNRQQS